MQVTKMTPNWRKPAKCKQFFFKSNLFKEWMKKSVALLRDMVDWGKKWLVHFNTGKTQLVLFDPSNNNGSICVKMDGSVLEEKSFFKDVAVDLHF